MNSLKALNTYQNNSVNTASKEKLLIMLLDGLVKFVKQGITAIEEKDIKRSNENFKKSQSIVLELQATLDFKKGGELATSLNLLYDYIYRRLVECNIKKDIEIAKECLEFCSEIRDTFAEVLKSLKK